MNKLVSVLKKIAVEMLLNEEMKKGIVDSLNKKINIPMVSEKVEAEFITAVVDATFEGISDSLEGDKNAKG
tara:strand:+ start:1082 stop:1294 length:213 start_codon:yes stop_codon:yes gene_type:complete